MDIPGNKAQKTTDTVWYETISTETWTSINTTGSIDGCMDENGAKWRYKEKTYC